MARWPVERVEALAPDPAALEAGRRLAPRPAWPDAGSDARAVWGRAPGSGSRAYEVTVDLDGPAWRCSCPSRKQPCKHVLGLLLRWVAGDVPEAGERPAAVREWLAQRDARAQAAPAARRGGAPDAEGRARRAEARAGRIAEGAQELERWLRDLVRQGLAAAQQRPFAFWDEAAARLVDAQAPGLANRVRRLEATLRHGGDWPRRALAELGALHLAARAWPSFADLDDPLAASLRTTVGWPVPAEAVREGPRVADRWAVTAVHELEDEAGLSTRRVWLYGLDGARHALLLDFRRPGTAFDADFELGAVYAGELAFYPAAAPLRALAAEPLERARDEWSQAWWPPPGAGAAAAALAEWSAARTVDPWVERWPVLLDRVTPVAHDGRWWVRDEVCAGLPVRGTAAPWRLVALAGGRPVGVAGEWRAGALWPLTGFAGGRVVAL